MIVDDNSEMRTIIRQHLLQAKADAVFVECADGDEAVACYRLMRPEWVLMDIKMAGSDGLISARRIMAEFPAAKIVFVTNFDDPDLRAVAGRCGARGYVTKERLFELKTVLFR